MICRGGGRHRARSGSYLTLAIFVLAWAGTASAQLITGPGPTGGGVPVGGSCATANGVPSMASSSTLQCSGVVAASGAVSSVTSLGMSGQLTSTLATGSAPFVIASTTRVPNLNVAAAALADAATALATPRTINGTSFDGTSNITVTVPVATGITGLGTGVATALAVNTGSAGAVVLFNGALGTPSSGTLTNATGLPVSTGVSGLGTGVATALAVNTGSSGAVVVNGGALGTPSSGTLTSATGLPISTGVAGLGTGVATALAVNTGSAGAVVLFNGALGTPSSGTLTNATGLPVSTGISGLGTGIATALAVNTGSAGAPVLFNGALGTPTSGTLTNATGLPISTGVSGLGSGVATFLATASSANLRAAVTDETGSGGSLVFATGPTITSATLNGDTTVAGVIISGTGVTGGASRLILDQRLSTNSSIRAYGPDASTNGILDFITFRSDGSNTIFEGFISGGWQVGSPTGGSKGTGTLNVASTYYANNTAGCSGTIGTTATNGIVTNCASDERLKVDLGAFEGGLDALAVIQPFRFRWTSDQPGEDYERVHVGFKAQNVRDAIPESAWLVRQADGREWYTLDTRAVTAALVNAVNVLRARVEALEGRAILTVLDPSRP